MPSPTPDTRREGSAPRHSRTSTRAFALLVFLLTLATAVGSLLRNHQLGMVATGLTDPDFLLGVRLRETGTFGFFGTDPFAFRAPGYPAFVAVALTLLGPHPRSFATLADYQAGHRSVYFCQAITLAAAASVLVLWLSAHLRKELAVTAGLVFGMNPYSVALAGLLLYDVLHLFLLIVSCFLLTRALHRGKGFLGAGLSWGIATLVRPVTLLLPALLLVVLVVRHRDNRRKALLSFVAFLSGFLGTVLPWTARNYAVTGRFVLVTQNAWVTLWMQTVRPLDYDANHHNTSLVEEDFFQTFQEVTGKDTFDLPTFLEQNSIFEARYKAQALENIRRRPFVYLRNCGSALRTFVLDINSVLLQVFEYLQQTPPPTSVPHELFRPGAVQDFAPRAAPRIFAYLVGALTLLASLGIVVAVRRRESWLLGTGAAFLSVLITHTLVLMSLMYYYVKLPFLFVFAFYGLNSLSLRVSRILQGLLLVVTLGLSAYLLFFY
jgi:4-amino-4-deoxy-L-arabinose transferase-like glycosyltransferase